MGSIEARDRWFAPAGGRQPLGQDHPGRGWFVYLRIFGPEQPAFDGTWRPGDFEPTD